MASEKASWTILSEEGGRFWIELKESREDELAPPTDENASEILLLTTDDMIVKAKIPPSVRKKDTNEVTIAK